VHEATGRRVFVPLHGSGRGESRERIQAGAHEPPWSAGAERGRRCATRSAVHAATRRCEQCGLSRFVGAIGGDETSGPRAPAPPSRWRASDLAR
jgi:hypothetical protein